MVQRGPSLMPSLSLLPLLSLLVAACGEGAGPVPGGSASTDPAPVRPASPMPVAPYWTMRDDLTGAALTLRDGRGAVTLALSCKDGGRDLRVDVPAFTPIGSEDRLSIGSNGAVEALVAQVTDGAANTAGVTATGSVPQTLASLVAGPLAASYGAQRSGPHPVIPQEWQATFVARCQKAAKPAVAPSAVAVLHPCRVQDGRALQINDMRAIGTEPFWGVRIEGRCLTYSHPDDLNGTRIWTRFAGTAEQGQWSGALKGRAFELRTRPDPACSDGMSDKRYPLAVELLVGGERRRGCAEPLSPHGAVSPEGR